MKSFPALLFVLALLTGCAAHAPSSADGALSEQSAIMESIDLYDPNSTLEAATQGAVRCFPLSDRPCEGLLPMADGILLVAPSTSTTAISKLAPESGRIAVSAELPFVLSPQDTSLHPMESGFSCFDAFAVKRVMAAGSPDVTGAMAIMCTLCASSITPITSAPAMRDKSTRIKRPSARTTPLITVSCRVCFLAWDRFISSPPPETVCRGEGENAILRNWL